MNADFWQHVKAEADARGESAGSGGAISEGEARFREKYGHGSLCNRVRMFRGRLLVNSLRKCTCYAATLTATPPEPPAVSRP